MKTIRVSSSSRESKYKGQYEVEISGRVFYINAAWISDENDKSGFTRFEVSDEDNWKEEIKQSEPTDG